MTAAVTVSAAPRDYEHAEATSAPRPGLAKLVPAIPRLRSSSIMKFTTPPSPSPEARQTGPIRKVKLKTKKLAETPYRIAGETFFLAIRRGRVTIRHPQWSLMGVGKTLADAEVALWREAAGIMRVYGAMPPATLDDEAARQFAFALRIAIA